MIQEIKVTNFLSFKDTCILNFDASKDTFAQDTQVVEVNKQVRLLRCAIIYGYNASGKSNLLKIFDYLDYFWNHKTDDIDEGTKVSPFKLDRDSRNTPTKFEIFFYVDKTKYSYVLELNEKEVLMEKLSYYKSTQPIMLFERTNDEGTSIINFNNTNPFADKINNTVKENIASKCLRNISFFVARNQVNAKMPLIDKAKDWMRNNIMPVIYPNTSLTSYAKRQSQNIDFNEYILKFLKEADFNVTDISTDIVEKRLNEDSLQFLLNDYFIPDNEKDRLKKEKNIKQLMTYFQHTVENNNGTENYNFLGKEESLGTLRVFGLEAALFQVMKKQGFLPIDEIETSLHPRLLEKILYEYLKEDAKSQILIATHEDGLLDLTDDLIRKDSVWFAEKGKNGATEIYKLTDFRGLNRLSSIREAYRNKRFGATMK